MSFIHNGWSKVDGWNNVTIFFLLNQAWHNLNQETFKYFVGSIN